MSKEKRPNRYDAEGTERSKELEEALDVAEQPSKEEKDGC